MKRAGANRMKDYRVIRRIKKRLRLCDSRETRDLHVGLHGSQRLPAQHLLPPARWTVEITLAHYQSSLSFVTARCDYSLLTAQHIVLAGGSSIFP